MARRPVRQPDFGKDKKPIITVVARSGDQPNRRRAIDQAKLYAKHMLGERGYRPTNRWRIVAGPEENDQTGEWTCAVEMEGKRA